MAKTYKLQTSNAIVYEDLNRVEDSIFENVYKSADRTLVKIIEDNDKNIKNNESIAENEQIGNVISFLGGRGRGKTSTMLSFVKKLNYLKKYEWSEIKNIEGVEVRFLDLPPIDAAMLAEKEFIIDAVLAEMWDKFERELQDDSGYIKELPYGKAKEKELKQWFVDTRHAYMVSQEHEMQSNRGTLDDLPTAGALHGLAASINLRQQMINLVQHYLDFFGNQSNMKNGGFYNSNLKFQTYLVIAIDDIDMSGSKAHYILEQIRRYLSIPNVIVMVTADIDRLQKSCEKRYEEIYRDERDRQQIISEYLEKVLPYNMRVHLPELNENHGKIIISTSANEKLDIKSNNEKDFILEFMMKKCGLYFDPTRRKRHFLQNYTMRSMVNYFEQLVRLRGMDYTFWLKTDIKERLIERISDREQKIFVEKLLTKDYEIMNDVILGYIRKKLDDQGLLVKNGGLGQVLYGCNLLENKSEENAEFVDCIIMLYSVILKSVDGELKKKIWGNSLLGNWEYNIALDTGTEFLPNFSEKARLRLEIKKTDIDEVRKKRKNHWEQINKIIAKNKVQIGAWTAMLLFVKIVSEIDGKIDFKIEFREQKEQEIQRGQITQKEQEVPTEKNKNNLNDSKQNGNITAYEVDIKPVFLARKNFVSCCYDEIEVYSLLFDCIKKFIEVLCKETERNIEIEDNKIEEIVKKHFDFCCKKEMDYAEKTDTIGYHTSSVEIVYAIGRAMNQVALLENNDEKECYNILVMKYRYIYEKLKKIDEYYNDILQNEARTEFAESFRNSIQAKILLDNKLLDVETKKEFESRMGKLLLEAKRSTSIITDLAEPGR